MIPIFLPGLSDPEAAGTVRRLGHSVEARAEQAEAVFARLHATLRGAGGTAAHICKVTMQITDRAFRKAVGNVRVLLAEAGADLSHVVKLVTYVTERGYLAPVRDAVESAFADAAVAGTELVVKGLAAPEVLMEIDVYAVLPA